MKIKFFKNVKIPTKSHQSDCGLDLYLPEGFYIEPGETLAIGLGIGVSIPEGFAGMIVPRSSTAKKGLICQTSIIDPGYNGEIHLIVTNASKITWHFEAGDRLGSLIVYSILNPYLETVEEFEKSERGEERFGSSGQ